MAGVELTGEVRERIIRMFANNKRMTMRGAAAIVGVDWRDVQQTVQEWKELQACAKAEARFRSEIGAS